MNFEHKTVLIIHPAWHSAGSHRVFCSQVEAYRALGATVLSLAVAPGFRLAESGAFWDFYLGNTKDLMAHERFVTGPSRRCLRSPAKWPRIVELIYANLAEQMICNAELSPLPERLLARNAIDLIHCNHFFNMPLALRLKERSGSPIILETHDVWANQFALRGGRSIYLNRKATVRELLEPELTYAALADVIVHVNADDCAFFTEALPGKYHVLLYPNADLRPPKPPAEHFLVVANANHANYLNVTWFLDRVAPLVRDLNVKIVG
jgi:hypothetical protein